MTSLLLLKSLLLAREMHKHKKRKGLKSRKSISKKLNIKKCRICYEEKGIISIFNNFVNPNISEEIKNFSGVIINKIDKLPKHICQNCFDLLNGCIMFRDMCQKNNNKLIQLSIKQECRSFEANKSSLQSSEDSNNIPSPAFSDCNSLIWNCSSCSKEFLDLESYNNHLSTCESKLSKIPQQIEEVNKNSFLCEICGKTAKSNSNLLVHMVIHDNVFPFKCDACPYQGRTLDLLKIHKRTHLIDKPFKCMHCPKATTTASNLAKHIRHVHSTNRPYKCNYCDKAFPYQHAMKKHLKDIHLRHNIVECDICYKKFSTKKILQGHKWKIHKIKGERQGRLPSYLLHQSDETVEFMNDHNGKM